MELYAWKLTWGLQRHGAYKGSAHRVGRRAPRPDLFPCRRSGNLARQPGTANAFCLEIFQDCRRCRGMASAPDISRVQECLDAAAHCEQRATMSVDPAAKATFSEAARCWHELARCWRELQRHPAPAAAPADFTRPSNGATRRTVGVAHGIGSRARSRTRPP